MVKLSDLARRPDFEIGPLSISPSRRRIEGPGGTVHLEPLIMQVFLILLDASGQVVTRSDLFDQCWGGAAVGDDSLNRAIAKVRSAASEAQPGFVEIETIPRTGYRLTTPDAIGPGTNSREPRTESVWMSRRLALGGTVAALAATGGVLWLSRSKADTPFEALMAKGDDAFRSGSAFTSMGDVDNPALLELYENAVRLNPGSARAWGLLAYFRSAHANGASPEQAPRLLESAQRATRRAFDLDPDEPNARVGRFLLEGRMMDWTGRDRTLRSILKSDPNNLLAMAEFMPLLQATGLTRESWSWNERILKSSRMAQPFLAARALKLWILGDVAQADRVIDRVQSMWPDDKFARYVRFTIFGLTGRPQAARTLLQKPDTRQNSDLANVDLWNQLLDALESPSAPSIARAVHRAEEAARNSPPLVNDLIMFLCALGQKDAAFEMTEGYLLWRGKMISSGPPGGRGWDAYNRRMTQWLFTPPVSIMRVDPRFEGLCSDFGLTAYWNSRGIRPDYLAFPQTSGNSAV